MDHPQRPSNESLLSAHRIATAAALDKESWLSDNHGLRGAGRLLLRVGRGGGSRFYFRSSKDGRREMVALGPYSRTAREGYLTLEQARALARRLATPLLMDGTARGFPNQTRASTSIAGMQVASVEGQPSENALTLMGLCRSYVTDLRKRKKSSAESVARDLERHVAGSDIAALPARNVTPEQVTRLLRDMIQSGIGRTTGRIRAYLHAAYEASLKAKLNPGASELLIDPLLTTNPVANISALTEYNGKRVANPS